MAVQVQCPSCNAIYAVFEPAVGRRVRCPDCQQLVIATRYEPPAGTSAPPPPIEEIVDLTPVEEEPVDLLPLASMGHEPPEATQELTGPPSESLPPVQPRRKAVILRSPRAPAEAEMDMTPMVDVTFQLLIFFMLTASFAMQKSLQVPKPDEAAAVAQPRSVQEYLERPDYIVVRVDAYNTYHVSAAAFDDEIEAPSEQELLVKLRQARQGDQQGNVPTKMLVVANGEALHERVVTAIDAGNEIGMEQVQVVTVEEDD